MTSNNQSKIEQFKTTVSGWRLHGQLLGNQQGEQIFILKIQSSVNKQQKYDLVFDFQGLVNYKLIGIFSKAKQLYEYLSKMTKLKIKFANQEKKLYIAYQKQPVIPIDLLSAQQNRQSNEIQKHQIQTSFTQKQQFFQQGLSQAQKSQQKTIKQQEENNKQHFSFQKQEHLGKKPQEQKGSQLNKNQQDSSNVADQKAKIEQFLRSKFAIRQKQQSQIPLRQAKQISYIFNKQSQSLNLYQYAISHKIDVLVDLVQSKQLQSSQQFLLKRCKLVRIPLFHQISLSSVKSLQLNDNRISKIQNLNTFNNLQKLNLDGNNISQIENVSELIRLNSLKLGNNQIIKISGLQNLVNLQILWLDFNNIEKIQNFNTLSKLKSLNISFNMLKKIQNLESCTNLEQLLLNQNQISQIQNLQNLIKLTRLSLTMNNVQKLRGLKKLLLLQSLYLSENQIQIFDEYAFEELNWLKMLKQFKITRNNIQWTEQSKGYIQRLKKYGVKVTI